MGVFDSLKNYTPGQGVDSAFKPPVSPTDAFVEKLTAQGFDLSELTPILQAEGNLLVNACAGSGKTTATTLKIFYDYLAGRLTEQVTLHTGAVVNRTEPVLVSTFTTKAVAEMKSAVRSYENSLGINKISDSLRISTLHSEFRSVLVHFMGNVSTISNEDNTKLLIKVLQGMQIFYNRDKVNDLVQALTVTRNRVSERERYRVDFYAEHNLTRASVDLILTKWRDERRKMGLVDFEDMQDILYQWLYVDQAQPVIEHVMGKYRHIYLDEVQDTSEIQYYILYQYFRGAKRIMAVGDDDQNVYTWRGSDNKIILERLPNDLNPQIATLTINRRCPSNIVDTVVPSITRNEHRYPKPIKGHKSGGEVIFGEFPSHNSMLRGLMQGIERDMSEGMSVAVLVRLNESGVLPAFYLEQAVRPYRFRVANKSMTFDSRIGNFIRAVPHLLIDRGSDKVSLVLNNLVYGKRTEVSKVIEGMKSQGSTLFELNRKEFEYSAPNVFKRLKPIFEVYDSWSARGSNSTLLLLKAVYNALIEEYFFSETEYATKVSLACSAVITAIENTTVNSATEFISVLNSVSESLSARVKADPNYIDIDIASVHDYKGREADSVYVFDASDGVFPAPKSNDVEEERRLMYIAGTRARKRVTYMYISGSPSMFIREMDKSMSQPFVFSNSLASVSSVVGAGRARVSSVPDTVETDSATTPVSSAPVPPVVPASAPVSPAPVAPVTPTPAPVSGVALDDSLLSALSQQEVESYDVDGDGEFNSF